MPDLLPKWPVIGRLIAYNSTRHFCGPNSLDWYRNLRIFLTSEDKLAYLEHHMPVAPVLLPGQQAPSTDALTAYTHWVKASKEIACLMIVSMTPKLQKDLEYLAAYEMLQELKTMVSQHADQELLQTVRAFHACKHEEGKSISAYVLKMKSYIDQLERLGHPVSKQLGVSLILTSLSKEYDTFMQNFNMNMHGMGKTIIVHELYAMLKLHEQTLPKKDATPTMMYFKAGRIQKKNIQEQKTVKGC
ncbi:hypothetical protein CTI12_AA106730 [Artemisia annua]|uniref:Zinc finger, CCHC-type n=1 Tax=Artemisia annua TaxID=35608 RepID=A0A2U1PVT7_ARTAN|nr:hypothetical protein CTI12_AA106730 [Artemisia annua]